MIDYHHTDNNNPIAGGYFTVNGEQKSCDEVYNLFVYANMKCTSRARPILSEWKKEADEAALFNEKCWSDFARENPYGIF